MNPHTESARLISAALDFVTLSLFGQNSKLYADDHIELQDGLCS